VTTPLVGLLVPAPTSWLTSPSLAELKALPKLTHPVDTAPLARPGNRAGRRERSGLGHLDLPWVGTVPDVGRVLGRLRAARGSWSARWSLARGLVQHAHPTFTAPTTAGDQAAEADSTDAETGADRASGPGETPGPVPAPVTALTSRPTRGPNLRSAGQVLM
jgi:hypothetical protein